MAAQFDLNYPSENHEEIILFDLNYPPENHEEESLFDLNYPPGTQGDEYVVPPPSSEMLQSSKKNINLTNEQRLLIYNALLAKSVNGKLKHGSVTEVGTLFSISTKTVQRIWKRAKEVDAGVLVDVRHRRMGNCGRKPIPIDLSQLHLIPVRERTTLRSLAHAIDTSHATVFRKMKQGLIRRHSSAVKPKLNEGHKRTRLQFCLSMLEQSSLPHDPKFINMYNTVHIDEKWFYMTKSCETYYLLPSEEEPLRTCQSKNFIGKVMFLAAMARPRFDGEGNVTFSGKIGVFPFITMEPAKRSSRNRVVGTLEIKPITSVNRDIIKSYLIEKVIPKIQELWPREDLGKTIVIQQDNARTHIKTNDIDFQEAASQTGFDIRLVCQPANSPDLNILDLGFFRAIQALQQKTHSNCVEDLIHAVQSAFDQYPARKVDHVFLSLQLCMQEIMRVGGCNKYKTPHINKNRLAREGHLPTQISCDLTIVQNVMNMLGTGLEY